jgi:hypothetical protein
MATIAEIRQRYPQYDDLSDFELAQGLYKSNQDSYSDLSFEEFASLMGVGSGQQQQPQTPQTEDFSSGLAGLGETALSMGSGIAGSVAGGLYGLASAPFVGFEEAAKNVKDVQEGMTYVPQTESGKSIMSGIARPFMEIEKGQQALGESALEATGSPLAATASYMAPDIASTIFGLGAFKSMKSGTPLKKGGLPTRELKDALNKHGIVYEELSPNVKAAIPDEAPVSLLGRDRTNQVAQQSVTKEIEQGGRQAGLAPYQVTAGKLGDDALAQEAIKQGFAKGDVQAVKLATPETKNQMNLMLSAMERMRANSASKVRPSDIVGRAVSKRLNFIADRASKAGSELNKIASKSLAGKSVDVQPVANAFTKSLDDLGVGFQISDGGKPVFDFKGSIIQVDPSSQRIIKSLGDLLTTGGKPDALRLHNLKRQLDALIDYRKTSMTGIPASGQRVLKSIRAELNKTLRSVDPDYARVNDVLSRSLGVFEQLDNATASKITVRKALDDPRAIGQETRKLFSNYQSRIDLDNALKELDQVVDEFSKMSKSKEVDEFTGNGNVPKMPNFNDSVYELANFANILDDQFGAVARSSFKGDIESAVKHGTRAATQGTTSATVQGLSEKAMEFANKMQNIDDYNAFRSMEELLKRGSK